MNKYKGKEKLMEIIFLIAACISIISVVLICIFLFMNGIPAMKKIGLAILSSDRDGDREIIFSESGQ